MTHDEMIAVIQAHKEGKTIQWDYKIGGVGWRDDTDLSCDNWDFKNFKYRIKPEPHYRPFKTSSEVFEALNGHGWVVNWDMMGRKNMQICMGDSHVFIPYYDECLTSFDFPSAFDSITFTDGTPFGKLEE